MGNLNPFLYSIIYLIKISQLIDAVNDFSHDVVPSLSDTKILRVNSMVNDIADVFKRVMLGFPDASLETQNAMRMSLLLFMRRVLPHRD
jgi:hypothetical protein